MNPFEMLGLPARYDLDGDDIERRYRELQKTLHPDRFVGRPSSERRMALSKAVEVNEAYRTLRDDIARARAMMEVRGEHPDDSQPADPEFLMEMMERREALGAAKSARDHSRVEALGSEVRRGYDAARRELAQLFANAGDPTQTRRVIARMKYDRRFLDEVEAILEEAL